MSNKGFTATATQFIRQLKQNLQEGRYEEGKFGFPIFKELVQNADDAGATTLHIGISDPPSGLKHPLLRSPGMFVINDGPFSRIDAKNLRRFGENSKASEVAKIGKFGLGLKSIFHLCEAFFFLGHLKEDTSKDFHAEILNPWSDERGGFYPEWNDFSEPDQGALWGSLATHFGGSKCFCIWIPLRQQAHCGNAPITNSFPGDALPNWLGVPELSVEIAKLIPMLMNVKSIHGWRGLGSKASKEFAISLHGNSSRRRSFDDLQPKEITTFGGSVHIDRGGKKSETVEYSGFELNPACKVLSVLQGNALWPNDLASDPATGKAIHVREKAQQHAGVTASLRRLQTGGGKLVIKWAVFLPLGGKDVLESEIPNCLLDVTLLLHGYFFVDAGRNDPLGMKSERCSGQSPSDEKQLRESWNQQLADVGTLPLIPEALCSLAKGDRGALQDHELRNVTKVLQDSDFFDQFRDQICARNHWAYIWKANRSLLWELVNSELPILELPFSADRNLPFDLFPSLPQVLRDHKVTVSDHPRLSRDAAAATWNADVACELLRRLDPEQLLGSKERAAYLVDCLDIFLRCKSDEGNRVVCRLLRDGLAKCGLDQPRKRQVPLAELVSHIPPESRLRLDLKEEYADELIRIVNQLGLDIVFVSNEMDCDTHPACAKISTDDLVRSLQGLSEKQQQNLPSSKKEAISMVAAQLIEAAADLPAAKEEIFDLPLFIAKNCRSQRTDLVSWNDLSRHRENKTIFLEPSPNAYSLQKALHKELILLVTNNQCFEILFSGDKATQCACSNVVDTIQRPDTPILSGPENRIVLLKWMLRAGADFSQTPQYQQVIRYLLHGNKSKCISDDPLWITSGGPSDVWRRITAVYLKTKQAEWSLIHSSFAEILTPESQRKFGITQIDSATVIPLIKDLGAEKFHGLSPSKAEYAELLKMIPEDQMCQQLPIHQDLEGNFVSIGECCYLDEERKLPESLIQRVTIIRGSEDHAARNRQGKLIPRMDSAAVVRTILECSNPGEYWQLLADSLAQDPELTPDMAYRIRRLKWLPLRQGGLASPDDLIILQEISDDVARLTAQHPNIFYEPGQLKDDVLSHASWPAISSKWMPDSDKALSMLGTLLLEDDRNSIGGLSDHLFDQWKEIASMIPTALLPCGELISKASSSYPSAEQQIFKELSTKKISDERVQEFLDCFRSLHQQERIKRRQKILIAVFNDYLRQKVDMQGYEVALTGQFLPNSLGGWLAAEELCCQSDGLAKESLVDPSTEEVLSNSMPASLKSKDLEFSVGRPNEGIAPDEANLQSDINDAERRLRKYFDTWRDIVPNEMIGGFLALLGDEPGIRRCAEEYLGKNRTIDKTRDSFGIPDWMHKSGELREDARTFIGKQRVIVELVAGERVEVSNLLGNPIQVARDQEPKSLFVSSGKRNCLLPRIAIDGCRIPCLRLNVIDPRKLDKLDLERLLLNSAKQFIYDVYNCLESQTTLDEAWNELSESEQLDIRVAQLRVTDRAFLTLEQLGLGGDPKISPILEQFHRAERLSAEQRSKSSKVATSDRRIPDDEKRQAADKLKELFENCGELQSKTLEATRRQVSQHYQYSPASVPFEIFQNADDAVVELLGHWNLSDDAVKASKTYHVLESDECVTFAHSGRRINEYPLERRSDTMGFDDDLLKMLVLSLSNKVRSQAAGSPEVTGKFGLGFKSCYLISERPQILSGRLVFEVTGAMYPRRLIGDERGILDSIWKKSLGGNSQTTIIHLPLLNETSSDVLEGFQRLVHLVVVFSRQIRHCVFHSKAREVAWEPKSLAMVEGGAFGRLVEISLDSRKPTRHGLQLESKYGSLLFAVDSRRITRFDGQIPSIWVTAPTRELLDLGFLINGPFALDIGRAQIARESEQNREHAKNLGIRIGEQFCQLFKACDSQEGWESLRGELKLAADATAYDFWDSIYELLVDSIEERSRGDKSAEQLVLDIFWKARNRGAARLYGSCCAIPSRMEGPYRQLVSLPQLRYGIEGLLANDPEIFSVVSKWKVFLDKSPPGTVVCGSRVLKKLKRLATEAGISVPTVRTLDIPMVLDWEFNGDNRSTPDQATRMGEVISKSTLDRMQGEEQEATRKFLKDLQFKGRDDQYHPAKSLLIGHETHWDRDDRLRDERHRAAFAPDHCVLSPEYDGLAIDLFDVSRDALDAPARVMVEWIVQANQISKQQAALNYLAEGELSHELCNELKRRGLEDTWMSDLRGSAAFQSLDETLKGRLLGLIPEEVRPTIDWAPAGVVPRSCRHIEDPAMVLDRLWVWWSSNRDRPQAAFEGRTYLEEYDHQIYPRGTPQLLTSDNSFDDLHCRKGWMTLFLLALMHTMGRTTRQQNRGFLFKCESEGWLDLFASSRWDGDQWLSFVEGYLQDQVEEPQYFHWMRQFVGIFQISKYLDDYIELFLSINRIDSQFCLGEILHPRSSSLHQGGGISPPPLSRVLGIGSCFVVRELFRRGILSSLHAMEHCFVPGRPVRNIFKNLGCELTDPKMRRWDMSRDLWRFAVNHLGPDRASMGRGFDIPFLFLSDNEQLYQQIFQTVDRRDNMLDDEADDIYGY